MSEVDFVTLAVVVIFAALGGYLIGANSRAVRWCHCRRCGEVWPWSMSL